MQGNVGKPKLTVSDGLYRLDHPDSDLFLPGSVWATSVRTLGDYIRHLQEVDEQSDKSNQSSEPNKSCQSDKQHCSCTNDCSGSQHAKQSCDEPCNQSCSYCGANATNTTDHASRTTEGNESEVLGWPCVVVGG